MGESAEDDVNLLSNKRLSSLLRDLRELRERGSFCDAVLEVQSRRYLAHKAVLSSTSGYFRALFLGAPCSSMGPFAVDFVPVATFEQVLAYVYRGDVTVRRADVRPLRRAARRLGLRCLLEACGPYAGDDEDDDDDDDEEGMAFDGDAGGGTAFDAGGGESGGSDGRGGDDDGRFDVDDFTDAAGADRDGWNGEKRDAAAGEGGRDGIKSEPTRDPRREPSPPAAPEGREWPVKAEEHDGRADCLYAGDGDVLVDREGDVLVDREGDGDGDDPWRRVSPPPPDDAAADTAAAVVAPFAPDPEAGSAAASSSLGVSPEKYYREEVRCGACGEPVPASVAQLRRHSRAHLDAARLACRLCGARFARPADAEEHALAHAGVPVWGCARCGRRFLSERLAGAHAAARCRGVRGSRAVTGGAGEAASARARAWEGGGGGGGGAGGGERVPCKVCAEPLAPTMSSLREHARRHVDPALQACRVCGLQMASSGNLVKHSLLHIGVLLFGCASCGKRFLFKNQLERHHKIRCGGGAAAAAAVPGGGERMRADVSASPPLLPAWALPPVPPNNSTEIVN